MIDSSTNTIRIPIEIALEDKEELQEIINKMKDGQVISQGNLMDFDKAGGSRNYAGIKKGIGTAEQLATNPEGFILNKISMMVPEIAVALIAAGFAEEIVKSLFAPGGPFDIRFRREIMNERDAMFTLQEQQARRIGQKQVIFTSFDGFHNYNGANVENTLSEVKAYGVSRLGLHDKAARVSP